MMPMEYLGNGAWMNGPAHYYANNAGRTSATWRKMRMQCYERDKKVNAPCWICGQPIDYKVRPSSSAESYEPDHRFPVSTHPELAEVPENVLPSHKKCNRSRQAKAGINSLGDASRAW